MTPLLGCSAALAALACAAPALAQTAPQPPSTPNSDGRASDANGGGIADIIVTAQRRSETTQRAAIAIDVVTPATLRNAGVVTATTLNAAVPALFVTKGGGSTSSFFIRGVGNFTNNPYSDPAVAFNVDGVYLGRPTSTTGTFFDLARIEVLKGPQGTLYGRNATGGAINVLPNKPVLGEFTGYASADYGRFEAIDLETALNAPLGDHAAFRVSGKLVNNNGFNADGTSDEKSEAVRAQLLGETGNLTARLAGDYSHTHGAGPGASYDGTLSYAPGAPASAMSPANYVFVPAPAPLGPRSGLLSPAAQAYESTFVIGGAFINPGPLDRPHSDNNYWGVAATVDLKTALGTLTVIPAYRRSSLDNLFNGPAFRSALIEEHDKQFSIEARFAGKSIGPIDWLIGGYYFDEKIGGYNAYNQIGIVSFQTIGTSTKSTAAFGRLTAHLTDRLRLVGGLRYTHDKKFFDGSAITLVEGCANAPPPFGPGCFGGPTIPTSLTYGGLGSVIPASQIPFGLPTQPGPQNARPFGANGNILFFVPVNVTQPISKNRATYRLAAEYDVAANSLLYVSYETGYRSGGFGLAVGHETYAPEYIAAATIGLKNRFFDNHVQLNIEAFRWQYRDQQVSHFGFDATGNNSYFTENIGRSRIQGVDVSAQFKAARNTLLNATVQYLDNRLTDFTYATPNVPAIGLFVPPVGCSAVPSTNPAAPPVFNVDCSGKRGFNSPTWSVNAGFEQTLQLDRYKIVFAGEGRYRSNRVIGFDYLPQENSGSDITIDASVRFAPHDDRWSLTAYVRNLTNTTVPVLTQYSGAGGNVLSTTYQPPRTYGVRAGFQF